MILRGDCLDQMKTLPDNSVDSIVTDPPYGLSFMGKKWDYSVPSKEIWIEALRVLKPGGHLLAFGGTRTYHRLVVNIEDAGFEIRDQVAWLYGQGFPKSMNISKQIDKQAGAKRTQYKIPLTGDTRGIKNQVNGGQCGICGETSVDSFGLVCRHPKDSGPSTDLAKQYQGWGTALKPANEPICVARKPISEKTVAANVIKWGTGGLNIDESRVGSSGATKRSEQAPYAESGWRTGHEVVDLNHGRWPANIIFDEDAAAELDLQSGVAKPKAARSGKQGGRDMYAGGLKQEDHIGVWPADPGGGASRFFYVAKASKRERNQGLEGMPMHHSTEMTCIRECSNCQGRKINSKTGRFDCGCDNPSPVMAKVNRQPNQNFHPTVKPIKLMEYLIKLVTPIGGTVLDPFMGSGSTGVAAKKLGFNFIGCELNPEYAEIAEKRIGATA